MHTLLASRRCSVRWQLQRLAEAQGGCRFPWCWGRAWEKRLPSVFTGWLWWGCCCCSLDTGCGRWSVFHVTFPVPNWAWSSIPSVCYRPPFNRHSFLSLSLSHLGLGYWAVCRMQLNVLNQTECTTAAPWCFPKDTSHAAIWSCLCFCFFSFVLVNMFSDYMKANSKETDPKVMAFYSNPSSPKRKKVAFSR